MERSGLGDETGLSDGIVAMKVRHAELVQDTRCLLFLLLLCIGVSVLLLCWKRAPRPSLGPPSLGSLPSCGPLTFLQPLPQCCRMATLQSRCAQPCHSVLLPLTVSPSPRCTGWRPEDVAARVAGRERDDPVRGGREPARQDQHRPAGGAPPVLALPEPLAPLPALACSTRCFLCRRLGALCMHACTTV